MDVRRRITSFEEYKEEYQKSVDNPEAFWAGHADSFVWKKKWDKVLDWNFTGPDVKWFEGGELNITENCLDRHLAERGDKVAILWEPNEPGDPAIKLTYKELHAKVCEAANMLKANGVQKGDRVCMYMPMIPELAIACLAAARIGAVHSVVFAGFSAQALSDRINDAEAKVVLTSDGNYRGKKNIPVKAVVDQACETSPVVESVIVVNRTGAEVTWTEGRDKWWNEEISKVDANCPATAVASEDMLFILYTSGSTGQPKGVVHTTGGYMVYTDYTFRNAFQYNEDDIYWCTADIGWITGHSYIIYGPLLAGATTMMFEGVPTYPDAGRFWEVCEKHKVNQFYTAPTAIRALQAFGTEFVEKYDLSSIKALGSVGEPINEEAWQWYHKNIGKGNCPIVDTYWQTETAGFLISPLAGITPEKPTFATLPMPGIQLAIMDADGNEIEGNGVEGNLCIKFPWPSIIRTTYGNHARCKEVYFGTYENMYFTGDGCRRDEDGYYRITGRVDDVINVSGHRMGTAEVENAINEHANVVESAVVGFPHEIKGQGIYAYVITEEVPSDEDAFRAEVLKIITKEIGPIAKPDKIQVVPGLPKTRSGKIMRRILRKVAEGDVSNLGDTSTLLDPSVVDAIKEGALVPLKS
ncbi:MAG: acetate--CoA ligase [Flavobacteriales bacterium]|nr:acetate--CoA ligase [Flavobacteriales bacterium]|tara:strand:- start:6415 stop:8331 length:1917 start_codon:yes stop_codon:yes gene_type:complete